MVSEVDESWCYMGIGGGLGLRDPFTLIHRKFPQKIVTSLVCGDLSDSSLGFSIARTL